MAVETKILITFIWVLQYQLHANGCALLGSELNWPNATVNYVLETDLNASEITLIEGAMNIIESNSCVKFVRESSLTTCKLTDKVKLAYRKFHLAMGYYPYFLCLKKPRRNLLL